jgi:uncharacterized protein (TIGR03435 family)
MKEAPVFFLTLAKGGFKLKPAAEGSCLQLDIEHLPEIPKDGSPMKVCGNQQMRGNGRTLNVKGTGLTMAEFAGGLLSDYSGRQVIDHTGIEGRYDIEMDFTMEGPGAALKAGGPDAPIPTTSDDGPSIFSALEKIGLKLEAGKGPVETIVIDRVERPSGN